MATEEVAVANDSSIDDAGPLPAAGRGLRRSIGSFFTEGMTYDAEDDRSQRAPIGAATIVPSNHGPREVVFTGDWDVLIRQTGCTWNDLIAYVKEGDKYTVWIDPRVILTAKKDINRPDLFDLGIQATFEGVKGHCLHIEPYFDEDINNPEDSLNPVFNHLSDLLAKSKPEEVCLSGYDEDDPVSLPVGDAAFTHFCSQMAAVESLRKIRLACCNLSEQRCRILASSFKALEFWVCDFQNGGSSIAEMVGRDEALVEELSFTDTPDLDLPSFMSALCTGGTSLKAFRLRRENFDWDWSIDVRLLVRILQENRGLTIFELHEFCAESSEWKELVKALKMHPTLKEFVVRQEDENICDDFGYYRQDEDDESGVESDEDYGAYLFRNEDDEDDEDYEDEKPPSSTLR